MLESLGHPPQLSPHHCDGESVAFTGGRWGAVVPSLANMPSVPDGPVLDRDVVHGEVGGVARRQLSIDPSGGCGDQAVGLVKGDPLPGELAAPPSSANSFGRAQRCTP